MNLFSLSHRRITTETFSSFQVGNYRLYTIGQVISASGTFVQSIAQSWLVWSIAFLGSTTIGGPAVGWLAETVRNRWGDGAGWHGRIGWSLFWHGGPAEKPLAERA